MTSLAYIPSEQWTPGMLRHYCTRGFSGKFDEGSHFRLLYLFNTAGGDQLKVQLGGLEAAGPCPRALDTLNPWFVLGEAR
jgi:hypothetical protein